MNYSDFLRAHLASTGESWVAFSKRAGISPAAFYKMLSRRTSPRIANLEKALRAAGYEISFVPISKVQPDAARHE